MPDEGPRHLFGGGVQRHDIGRLKQLGQRHEGNVVLSCETLIGVRVAGEDAHAEGSGTDTDRLADPAQPHQPKGGVPQLHAEKGLPRTQPGAEVSRHDLARQRQQQRHRQVSNRVVDRARGEGDDDASGPGRGQVYGFQPDTVFDDRL